ncbi:hypothetical protein Lal_00049537, partial [Lupinus albus]
RPWPEQGYREKNGVEVHRTSNLTNAEINRSLPKRLKEETRRYSSNREVISSKYASDSRVEKHINRNQTRQISVRRGRGYPTQILK